MENQQKIQYIKSRKNKILLLISLSFNMFFGILFYLKHEKENIFNANDQKELINEKIKYKINLDFDSLGYLYKVSQFSNENIIGEQLIFSNKNLFIKKRYLDNTENGVSFSYYQSGMPDRFIYFINGIRQGVGNEFYDTTGALKNLNYYNEFGTLIYRGTYKNDSLIKEEGNLDIKNKMR